ncbi:MAG: GerMN domain-containing protein [Nitrospinae bacterium]|nr:GerMN domain-containing protein [Nitrospinota bacterium]
MSRAMFLLVLSLLSAAPPPAPAPARAPASQRVVTLFLPGSDGGLTTQMAGVRREAVLEKEIKSVLDILSAEWERAAFAPPKSAKVQTVFIDAQKTVYLAYNEEITARHPGGITMEIASAASICKTVMTNYDVDGVRFLQKGRELKTLAGHVDVGSKITRAKCDNMASFR